jgi:hypothetical protein
MAATDAVASWNVDRSGTDVTAAPDPSMASAATEASAARPRRLNGTGRTRAEGGTTVLSTFDPRGCRDRVGD